MSLFALEVVRTTTGIYLKLSSALIFASTSRPFILGRFRSSRIISGYGSLAYSPSDNIIEKLSNLPGIDAISKGHGIASPVIRGLSTTNIVMLNNGIRIENYQFSENHPYTIDDSDISIVEIIKRPASLLYGSDAVGGLLNFIKE